MILQIAGAELRTVDGHDKPSGAGIRKKKDPDLGACAASA
jgi:hypothetical protein